jgi:hypothetical protein
MSTTLLKAQNPLILRYHRLLEAFSKSDDERDFFFDKIEGFLVYLDLDKEDSNIDGAEAEILAHPERYAIIPKMTYYETKKFMEGFVHEKVYDIDTKEKLLDIIDSKESRENFIEFIYDHPQELDKWQQYYHERSRIRIIEWLRHLEIRFVFEEDLELAKNIVEKLKLNTFETKVSKDVAQGREMLVAKAKTYYSNEALNPRPKRGRPPKQIAKVEIEPQFVPDIYRHVPADLRSFLFMPDYSGSSATFSAKFDSEAQLLASLRGSSKEKVDAKLELLSQRLESLRQLSGKLKDFKGADIDKALNPALKASLELGSLESKMVKPVTSSSNLMEVAKEFLPKKRGRPSKEEEASQDKKTKKIKTVVPIVKKKT